MAGKWVIGVDLGGTKVAVGAVSSEGRLAGRIDAPTRSDIPAQESLAAIAELVRRALADSGMTATDLNGIGFGAPGPLDPVKGVIHFAPNLNWREVAVKAFFEAEFPGVPVRLQNDANAAALGELSFGAGRGFEHFIYVTVSTGIGGGLILNSQLYDGATGGAGEVGHMTVDYGGPLCGCGRRGCLEALASGTAIARMARERVRGGAGGELARISESDITAATVGLAARQGDPVAREVLETAFTQLGRGLANLVNLLNPQALAGGGGVTALWDIMEPVIRRELSAGCVVGFADALVLRKAELGANVGVYGAAALFRTTALLKQ